MTRGTARLEPRLAEVSAADFERRARTRLSFELPAGVFDRGTTPPAGDHLLDGLPPRLGTQPRAAAVLMPVIPRPEGASMLLTLRTTGLRDHAGQIAFPGGKIDPSDASPAAAALREAEEEVGLEPAWVTPLGYLAPYLTGTGFLIVPTVGLVRPAFRPVINVFEVAEVFEVPLGFLMEAANHQKGTRDFNGVTRSFYAMPYGERYIWGITAGLIRNLYERLYL